MSLFYLLQIGGDKVAQFDIESLDRESHYIEERPLDALTSHIAYPLLYSVGSSFIEWTIVIYVVINLFICNIPKKYFARHRETLYRALCAHGNTRNYRMLTP